MQATTVVTWWLEHLLRELEVVCSIPGRHRPKSSKLVVVAFPLALRTMGIALRLTRQCQDNGLVKKDVVQDTWICELSPFNN